MKEAYEILRPYLPLAAILIFAGIWIFSRLWAEATRVDESRILKDAANREHNALEELYSNPRMTQDEIDNFNWRD